MKLQYEYVCCSMNMFTITKMETTYVPNVNTWLKCYGVSITTWYYLDFKNWAEVLLLTWKTIGIYSLEKKKQVIRV